MKCKDDIPAGAAVRRRLLRWFSKTGRRFFWRDQDLSPFHFLMLEVLLVRTRAESVEGIAKVLFERCPDPMSLVALGISTLEPILRPLGLSRKRAKALYCLGSSLVVDHDGIPLETEAGTDR